MGLCDKVLVMGGTTGVASVRSFWKLPPCATEPMSTGSKMDPVLANSESISDDGSASGITELGRGGMGGTPVQWKLQPDTRSENMERNSSRSVKNEREEVSRQQSRASLAACGEEDGEVAVTL